MECNEDQAEECFWRAVRHFNRGSNKEAVKGADNALWFNPLHLRALVLLGEIYLLRNLELGIGEMEGARLAATYFDRALRVDGSYADALSGLGLAMLHLDNPSHALQAADQGISIMTGPIEHGCESDSVWDNVYEALLDVRIRSLLELGRDGDAEETISHAIKLFPESAIIRRHLLDEQG